MYAILSSLNFMLGIRFLEFSCGPLASVVGYWHYFDFSVPVANR